MSRLRWLGFLALCALLVSVLVSASGPVAQSQTSDPNSRRTVALRPSGDGHFTVGTLPPGEYLVAAALDVDNGEWENPAFLTALAGNSVKISLAGGEKKVQNLRVK